MGEEVNREDLDYDLASCLEYNPQPGITHENITEVLAVWEGENDVEDWRWVVALDTGKFAFIQGGCDYTGWDCQSWASSAIVDTPQEAAKLATGEDLPVGTLTEPIGFGHMLAMISGSYTANNAVVHLALLEQIEGGKNKTWREAKDEELGVKSGSR